MIQSSNLRRLLSFSEWYCNSGSEASGICNTDIRSFVELPFSFKTIEKAQKIFYTASDMMSQMN